MIKPGYKTSEFWFTAVSFIFSGLYLIGLFGEDNQQKEDLIRDVSHGVESIILIGGQLAILFKYLNGRKEIKKTFYSSTSPSDVTENTKPNDPIPVPSRKSKSRSRKSNSRKSKNTRRS
jgi:hypothetical protein